MKKLSELNEETLGKIAATCIFIYYIILSTGLFVILYNFYKNDILNWTWIIIVLSLTITGLGYEKIKDYFIKFVEKKEESNND